MNITLILISYLVLVNIIGFTLMGIDKRKARREEWRIPEKTLWMFAWIGGALGAWFGMRYFRHKTKHTLFVIGLPFLVVIYIILYVVIKARLLS